MTELKLCTDCKWHRPRSPKIRLKWGFIPVGTVMVPGEFDRCAHPSAVSRVDGEPKKFCDIERGYVTTDCAIIGRLWEAKPCLGTTGGN